MSPGMLWRDISRRFIIIIYYYYYCCVCCRASELRAGLQQVTVAAVQPASHHLPSFGSSPPMRPPDLDTAHRLIHSGVTAGRRPSSPPRPPPPPLPLPPTAAPASPVAAMIGSHSNPLVGSMRGPAAASTATAQSALPRRLLTETEYMQRFRFMFMLYVCTAHPL